MPDTGSGPRFDPRPDREAIRAALSIDRRSSARARTIDLTTTGARSGRAPHDIWFYRAGDELRHPDDRSLSPRDRSAKG